MFLKKSVRAYLGCALFFILSLAKVSAAENYNFAVVDKFNIGGEGRWDYLTYDTKQQHPFFKGA